MHQYVVERYKKCEAFWDEIFSKELIGLPGKSTGNADFDHGINWACKTAETVVDFGCGNGTLLCICAMNGTKIHFGIDLSFEAVKNARKRAEEMPCGEFVFMQGDVLKLMCVGSRFADTVILSNIIDNLYPDDAEDLLNEAHRILKPGGKLLVKLNPFITEKQIEEWGIRRIKANLLDDGLILLNNTTEQWKSFFERLFLVEEYHEIYFPEHDQINRMFMLLKK